MAAQTVKRAICRPKDASFDFVTEDGRGRNESPASERVKQSRPRAGSSTGGRHPPLSRFINAP